MAEMLRGQLRDLIKISSSDRSLLPSELGHHFFSERYLYMTGMVSLFKNLHRPIKILEVDSWIGGSCLTWATVIGKFSR